MSTILYIVSILFDIYIQWTLLQTLKEPYTGNTDKSSAVAHSV